jgi:hypothetical protein
MRLRTRIRILEVWAFVSIAVIGVLLVTGANQTKTRFAEIDVERINVVERDGRILMMAANTDRMPDPVINGRSWKTERPAGMLFYNGLGDETGGLVYGAVEGKGQYGSYQGLSFDKYKQAQAMALVYNDHNGKYRAGLQIWDRPEVPLNKILSRQDEAAKMADGKAKDEMLEKIRKDNFSPTRVYLGKNPDSESELTLSDAAGRPRIRMSVGPDGNARLDFLDEKGNVIDTMPTRKQK